MNYLAHTLLSRLNIEYQAGNILADHVKGVAWSNATETHLSGLKMHTAIDAFTDTHPCVSRSKSRLGAKGYLKGVVIDIAYDYLLSRHWHRFSSIELQSFVTTFNRRASRHAASLPRRPAEFIERIAKYNILAGYGDWSGLEITFNRLDHRLSPRILAKENTSSYLPVLADNMADIERDFLRFFPDLIRFFIDQETLNNAGFNDEDHCLIVAT